jgi:hypothetical protein
LPRFNVIARSLASMTSSGKDDGPPGATPVPECKPFFPSYQRHVATVLGVTIPTGFTSFFGGTSSDSADVSVGTNRSGERWVRDVMHKCMHQHPALADFLGRVALHLKMPGEECSGTAGLRSSWYLVYYSMCQRPSRAQGRH